MSEEVVYKYLEKGPFYKLVHSDAFFLSPYRVKSRSDICSELQAIQFLQEKYPNDYLICPGYHGNHGNLVDIQIGITGSIEMGETAKACAVRELEEEVCLQIETEKIYPIPTSNTTFHGNIVDCVFDSAIGELGKISRGRRNKSFVLIHGSLSDCEQVIGSKIIESKYLHDNVDRIALVPISSFKYDLIENKVWNTILKDPPKNKEEKDIVKKHLRKQKIVEINQLLNDFFN